MKKFVAFIAVVIMCLAMVGCKGAPSIQKVEAAPTVTAAPTDEPAEVKSEDWKWFTDNVYDIITSAYNYGKVFIEDGDLVVMFGNYEIYDTLAPYVNVPALQKEWNSEVRPKLDKSAAALCEAAKDAGFTGSVHYILVDETYTHIMYWNIDGVTILDIFNN